MTGAVLAVGGFDPLVDRQQGVNRKTWLASASLTNESLHDHEGCRGSQANAPDRKGGPLLSD